MRRVKEWIVIGMCGVALQVARNAGDRSDGRQGSRYKIAGQASRPLARTWANSCCYHHGHGEELNRDGSIHGFTLLRAKTAPRSRMESLLQPD
jgi:hypothetical protein